MLPAAVNKSEPIAIIGMGCRFPDHVYSPGQLWDLCCSARNTWSSWPKDRMMEDGFYHPRPDNLGTNHSRGGHFLGQDVTSFDATFFNFTAEMTKAMDPQIRLMFETVFEALETAGISLEQVAGTATSVFAGSMFHDYNDMLMQDLDRLPRSYLMGNVPSMLAN
ncbi:hypothetical protein QQS21_011688 [Conoideocrella luteorostrata]|uniref:Ketosynthase family 3 (KS3) domain-containing protein n=1 Tax=Conoideocrella luteorostrata TaxID=1105319 RepID=A0AAJ0FNB9_9HYPO|nr:hypothetical protein QQS21_011688 [Conoideocrella luteorostrata]